MIRLGILPANEPHRFSNEGSIICGRLPSGLASQQTGIGPQHLDTGNRR
jgi:hypothetical protein